MKPIKSIVLIFCCLIMICTPIVVNAMESDIYHNQLTDRFNVEKFIQSMTESHKELLIRSIISKEEETMLAKTVYGEDRDQNLMHRSAVIWSIFNRLDSDHYKENTIKELVTHNQFHGYFPSQKHPRWTHILVRDVALRYVLEKLGYENVGRTLPSDYLYFGGSTGVNRFRKHYKVDGHFWDWSCFDPYYGKYSFEDLGNKVSIKEIFE